MTAPEFPLQPFLATATDRTIREPARDIPVIAECDVAVLGGGTSGLCAAVAAARQGASVVLVEHYGFLGGMATSSLVNIWHSFYGMDRKTKIIGGVPDDLIAGLKGFDAVYNADAENETAHWVLDSEKCKFVCDDLVLASGVKLMLHTSLAGVLRDGRRIDAALVESKSGRGAIVANTYLDCTGDADLVRFAGVQTQVGNAVGGCQAPSLCFRLTDVDLSQTGFEKVQAELFKTPMNYNNGHYPPLLWASRWPGQENEWMAAGVRVLDVNSANADDLTRAEIEGRYQLRWFLEQARRLPGWQDVRLTGIGTQIGPRESHRIIADHELTREEVLYGHRFPDAIAQGTYPIDIHNPSGPGIVFEDLDGTRREVKGDRTTLVGRWDGLGPDEPKRDTLCYQVPLGGLVPRELDNVMAAGRNIGASHESAGAIRVMVNCMQAGQAAGVAAALAGKRGVRAAEADQVRTRLVEMGMPLL